MCKHESVIDKFAASTSGRRMKRSRTISSSSITHITKYTSLSDVDHPPKSIQCNLPPHDPLTFDNIAAYETHYTTEHVHRCAECTRNLPSAHLLELHLAENHDPFQAAKKEAGEKIYKCFVEGCDKVCSDWQKRRSHLIDKHGYPRNYDFFIVWNGLDGKSSLLRRGVNEEGHKEVVELLSDEHSTQGPLSTAVEEVEAMDNLSSELSSLTVVPSSITFGRQKGKAGFSKK